MEILKSYKRVYASNWNNLKKKVCTLYQLEVNSQNSIYLIIQPKINWKHLDFNVISSPLQFTNILLSEWYLFGPIVWRVSEQRFTPLKDSKNSSIQRRTQKMGCSSAGEFMSSSKNGEKEWLAMDNPIYQNQRSQFLKTFYTYEWECGKLKIYKGMKIKQNELAKAQCRKDT